MMSSSPDDAAKANNPSYQQKNDTNNFVLKSTAQFRNSREEKGIIDFSIQADSSPNDKAAILSNKNIVVKKKQNAIANGKLLAAESNKQEDDYNNKNDNLDYNEHLPKETGEEAGAQNDKDDDATKNPLMKTSSFFAENSAEEHIPSEELNSPDVREIKDLKNLAANYENGKTPFSPNFVPESRATEQNGTL